MQSLRAPGVNLWLRGKLESFAYYFEDSKGEPENRRLYISLLLYY